jgi:SAM-dependent methyltransferase
MTTATLHQPSSSSPASHAGVPAPGSLVTGSLAPDALTLYRWAVQDPEIQSAVLERMFRHYTPDRAPLALREDFAGTSADSVAWVAMKPGRTAIAVDRDAPTLDWARRRAEALLGPLARRVSFHACDVLDLAPPACPAADIISALNFSACYLHERDALLAYLRHVRACLAPGGVLAVNTFGGEEASAPGVTTHEVRPTPRLNTERPVAPFRSHWQCEGLDAGTRRIRCRLHFEVFDAGAPGGRQHLRDAFVYDWRLWTPAELGGAMLEAGFARAQTWRHTYDPARGAEGVFLGPVEAFDEPASWTAYVVGVA